MNDKKFCFIVCSNSQLFMEECQLYIEQLYIPEEHEVQLLTIENAKSMAAGYNEAMESTDAKYKIYLHQDVFIINKYFLYHILEIFNQDEEIGLIGMVGSKQMPSSGVMWNARQIGNIYSRQEYNLVEEAEYLQSIQSIEDVEAVDGLCMITSKDIYWREDIFDGWDFYDASQSAEFLRAGYRVVVPTVVHPWCLHDDGQILSMWNYDKYRKKYLEEYTVKEENEKGISFIMAVNDNKYYEECCYYINKLKVPEGFTVDIIALTEAASMAAAYNEGMLASKAKYKVYMHQDTFITDPDFITNILEIFEQDSQIGLIGVIGGTHLSSDGIIYNSWNQGKTYGCGMNAALLIKSRWNEEDKGLYALSDAVDGMIMITQYDICWREDLFKEWDFYDISQSFEFRRKGYKVVVANQEKSWCLHDCGHSKLSRYDANRKIFLKEYTDLIAPSQSDSMAFDEARYHLGQEIYKKLVHLVKQGYLKEVCEILDSSFDSLPRFNELSLMKNILEIYRNEMKELHVNLFMSNYKEYEQICEQYKMLKFYLRRVDYFADSDAISLLKKKLRKNEISSIALILISQFTCISGYRVVEHLSDY